MAPLTAHESLLKKVKENIEAWQVDAIVGIGKTVHLYRLMSHPRARPRNHAQVVVFTDTSQLL